jgi:hypothetical protein
MTAFRPTAVKTTTAAIKLTANEATVKMTTVKADRSTLKLLETLKKLCIAWFVVQIYIHNLEDVYLDNFLLKFALKFIYFLLIYNIFVL